MHLTKYSSNIFLSLVLPVVSVDYLLGLIDGPSPLEAQIILFKVAAVKKRKKRSDVYYPSFVLGFV